MQLIWHPDGKHLIVSNGGRLERWDITSVERTNIYDNGFISGHMDMTSDGNLLVSETSNNSITVWDVDSTEILHQLYVEDTLIAVALDDVGSRVAANSGDTILIWSLATEKTLASLQSSGLVLDLVWNADILTTMSSLSDGTVEITAWDTNTYSSTQTVQSSLIFDVALDSTGTCLAYGQSLDTLQINEISERSCN
jgi:WD40 repeat protein